MRDPRTASGAQKELAQKELAQKELAQKELLTGTLVRRGRCREYRGSFRDSFGNSLWPPEDRDGFLGMNEDLVSNPR